MWPWVPGLLKSFLAARPVTLPRLLRLGSTKLNEAVVRHVRKKVYTVSQLKFVSALSLY